MIELALAKRDLGLTGYDVQVALREHYIDTHELCDLDNTTRPWALVSDGPRDGLRELWGWDKRLSEFELYEITKYYGYNFTEFVKLPRHMVERILENRRAAEKRFQRAKEEADLKAKREKDQLTESSPSFRGFDK